MPFFSVILATRDRPALFAEALRSVLAQDFADIEIVVVNDGSREEHRVAYEAALAAVHGDGRPVRAHWLVHRPRGHGQSYSLNYGAAYAKGAYLCFLDDDDTWTDTGHLSRAARALRGSGTNADLYMTNQAAYRNESRQPGPIWIEGLAARLVQRGIVAHEGGAFPVAIADLIAVPGFCHLNTLIVSRSLYDAVGGMDEAIRWECDRDLFLRLIDRAEGTMLHHPAVVARHNIPDPSKGASMTTSLAALDRWLYQLRVLDKASLFARHPPIRAHGRQHKVYALKRIAEELYRSGRWTDAAFYAREALWIGFNPKWFAFAAYLTFKAFLSSSQRVSEP